MTSNERVDLAATYARDGIVRLPGAFAGHWALALRGAIERVFERWNDPAWERTREFAFSPQDPLIVTGGSRGVAVGGTMAVNVVAHDPVFAEWIRSSPAAELVGTLTGSRSLRYWTDAVFIKEGRGEDGTPWHNDYCTWPFTGERLPILWIALDDVGPEDAPLVTVRGSHTDPWRYYSPMSPPGLAITPQYHAWDELLAKAHDPEAIRDVWTVQAGDALLMHSKLIHSSRSRTNARPGRRVSFSTRWLGDDARWSPDAYSFEIKRLRGDPRMVPGQPPPETLFPIVWRRAAA